MVLFGVGYSGYDFIQKRNLRASNEAYAKLLKNPKDSAALRGIKKQERAII